MSRIVCFKITGLLFLALVAVPHSVNAQTAVPSRVALTTGIAMTSQWDDADVAGASPGGAPAVGTSEERTWRFTKPGFGTGLGVEIRGKGRMSWRPEGVNTLEIPLIAVRGGVTVLS